MSVEVRNLSFSYGEHQVLKDISFSVNPGEFLSILGPNGVGKSTLFRCILGLIRDYTGNINVDNHNIKSLSIREMSQFIAYIPQSSSSAFNYSVFDIVLMGTTSGLSAFRTPQKEEQERVEWAMAKMGISHLEQRCFHRISGGERQLVMIARALVQRAPILMLDEPTANLDFGNQIHVLSQVKALTAEGYTVIQTTHDPQHTYMFSDRVLALKDGRVLTEGPPKNVLDKSLISALYGVDVEVTSLFNDHVRVCTPGFLVT
ncbi:ABC transporter ATP-binding protein [Oscillospiraceae bacterium LTW-04]|nr:ABC transporter ATP-binding protein [Oscillospiraceae bacterium MB24-C1]